MGSRSKGKQDNKSESALKTLSDTTTAKANELDPLTQEARTNLSEKAKYVKSGQFDINKAPGLELGRGLARGALGARDEARIGRGLAYGENANESFATALSKENDLERRLRANLGLEEDFDREYGSLDEKLAGYGQIGDQRNLSLAQLASGNYFNFLNARNNRRPGIGSQLLAGAFGGLSAVV